MVINCFFQMCQKFPHECLLIKKLPTNVTLLQRLDLRTYYYLTALSESIGKIMCNCNSP